MRATPRRAAALLMALALTLALAGCGLQSSQGYYRVGELPDGAKPLAGVKIGVTSKNFTEQILLGKMTAIVLASAGATVNDMTTVPGTQAAREAILSGASDVFWDYTGTAWLTYLGQTTPISNPQQQWEAVKDRDLVENDLTWLPPANFNNTYAFAVERSRWEELGKPATLSDLKKLPAGQRTFCVDAEFASREDGFTPMLAKYGIPLGQPTGVPQDNVRTMDTGVVYTATADHTCNFGEVFATDGRIKALDLVVLKDDLGYFPAYNGAPMVRADTLAAHPEVGVLLEQIAQKLTDEVLRDLNGRVDISGEDPADVAFDWLQREGIVTS